MGTRDYGWDGFNLSAWALFLAFVGTLAYAQLSKPSADDLKAQRERNEKMLDYRAASEKALAEKIRQCSINAPPDECERVFRCDDDPCYCSPCD
jgi:hypothetical protein